MAYEQHYPCSTSCLLLVSFSPTTCPYAKALVMASSVMSFTMTIRPTKPRLLFSCLSAGISTSFTSRALFVRALVLFRLKGLCHLFHPPSSVMQHFIRTLEQELFRLLERVTFLLAPKSNQISLYRLQAQRLIIYLTLRYQTIYIVSIDFFCCYEEGNFSNWPWKLHKVAQLRSRRTNFIRF